MPTLFISYKRGTTAVGPIMEALRAASYRLWFDRDEIFLGDPDWQARIDQGINLCDGVILNITPEACLSEPVRYEVQKARELGKPIFPIIVERIENYDDAILALGLPEKQHIEDFTDVAKWDELINRLLVALNKNGLQVTRHDHRRNFYRTSSAAKLYQKYLRRLVERVGSTSFGYIGQDDISEIFLEQIYLDLPTDWQMDVKVNDWKIVEWRLNKGVEQVPETTYSRGPLESVVAEIEQTIAEYQELHPNEQPADIINQWQNGEHANVWPLTLQNIVAACDRLVILGAPGSGKSTFVRYLALCLAGEQLEQWDRDATLSTLGNWPHGSLTPIYIELGALVASKYFPHDLTEMPDADVLMQYINSEILGATLVELEEEIQLDMLDGNAMLILDGLDEVSCPPGQLVKRQRQLQYLMASLHTSYPNSRIIITSRPYAYREWLLREFQTIQITKFNETHRTVLARKLFEGAGLSREYCHEHALRLDSQLAEVPEELKDRPLFLTLMAAIYFRNLSKGLPTRRGSLYRQSIFLLLERWTHSKPGTKSLLDILGGATPGDLFNQLAALAYDIYLKFGVQADEFEIPTDLLDVHLMRLSKSRIGVDPVGLFAYLSENAGVIVSLGQNSQQDVFRFAHLTFQEYLAAVHVVNLCTSSDSFVKVRDLMRSQPDVWRESAKLVADILADTDRVSSLWHLIDDLLIEFASNEWPVWLAGQIVKDQEMYKWNTPRRGEQVVRKTLVDSILHVLQNPGLLEMPERSELGLALGLLGDPRNGVGLRDDGLPDLDWVRIPAGTFIMGDNSDIGSRSYPQYTFELSEFEISRFPITISQFSPFYISGEYNSRQYWTQEGWARMTAKWKSSWEWIHEGDFNGSLPISGVNWYEAMAYCNWLSKQFGYHVSLPSEAQWHKAARGTEGKKYPYGDSFDFEQDSKARAFGASKTIVGIAHEYKSPFNVFDMFGCVDEWTYTRYQAYPYDLSDGREDPNAPGIRVLQMNRYGSANPIAIPEMRAPINPILKLPTAGFRIIRLV